MIHHLVPGTLLVKAEDIVICEARGTHDAQHYLGMAAVHPGHYLWTSRILRDLADKMIGTCRIGQR